MVPGIPARFCVTRDGRRVALLLHAAPPLYRDPRRSMVELRGGAHGSGACDTVCAFGRDGWVVKHAATQAFCELLVIYNLLFGENLGKQTCFLGFLSDDKCLLYSACSLPTAGFHSHP